MMSFMQTGDRSSFRDAVMKAAQSGEVGAELMLAEQYIPERCTFEIDQDVPHCGKDGNEPPKVVFRQNPLGLDASYEEAAHWLERASAHGSGEASEVLAQLITPNAGQWARHQLYRRRLDPLPRSGTLPGIRRGDNQCYLLQTCSRR